MNKKTFKGKISDIVKEFNQFVKDNKLDKNNYTLTLSDNRTIQQNSKFHAMVRELADHLGELDIELLKKQIKKELGYYKEEKVETEDTTYSLIVYEKTSEMSVKELAEFINKFEIWALNNLEYKFKNND